MKLTKGKVPKLLSKKKQSLKRYKKGKKQGNKRRTFRKRGSSIDLSKKTLKNIKFRMKGGDEEEQQEEQQQETVINNGTMEQSLASLKEMTVGDLVSYLAQEIANKTLQTTLGPQTTKEHQITEEVFPAAVSTQADAGVLEEEEQKEQQLADIQPPPTVEGAGLLDNQEEKEEQQLADTQTSPPVEEASKMTQNQQTDNGPVQGTGVAVVDETNQEESSTSLEEQPDTTIKSPVVSPVVTAPIEKDETAPL